MTRVPPPRETRFRKGQSGNPKGRPRKVGVANQSAFDVVIDRMLPLAAEGGELSVEEALQQRTYQQALAGNRTAQREVLRMIEKREAALAAKRPSVTSSVKRLVEHSDPENAEEALLLLDIACPVTDEHRPGQILLQPWAVQAAFARRRGEQLKSWDIADIRRSTRDPDEVPALRRGDA